MRYPKLLRQIDSLHERIMLRPAWVRALLIIGITLASMWIIAMGLQRGLHTSGLTPPYEGADAGNPWRDAYNAKYRQLLWQEFGLRLTGVIGLIVALFLHSLIGAPTFYSRAGKIALGLQLLTTLALFEGFGICVFGSFTFCYIPLATLIGAVHTIRFRGIPPLGDWLTFLWFLVYVACVESYGLAWSDVFFDG